ncbi:MAG: polysaccharide deacetylase [Clostridia bacterium]|nr:polysaccharide deacetylase [Clostridia bacterium]
MRKNYKVTYTRKGYKPKKKLDVEKFFMHIGLPILIIAVLFSGVAIAKNMSTPKYDETIIGSPYSEQLLSLPAPTPTPVPRDDGVAPSFEAEYVQAYNGYEGEKIAYLTFDDGPTSNITPRILDVLKEKDVKATFFVLGKMVEAYPEMAKRAVQEGHVLANHSYSHDYKSVYDSKESFFDEIKRSEELVINTVGEEGYTRVFRFPGGSAGKPDEYKLALSEIDYVYVDWNALNGDAEGHNVAVSTQLANIKETTNGRSSAVILMHDAATKDTTVAALPQIIDYLRSQGFTFKTLKR